MYDTTAYQPQLRIFTHDHQTGHSRRLSSSRDSSLLHHVLAPLPLVLPAKDDSLAICLDGPDSLSPSL